MMGELLSAAPVLPAYPRYGEDFRPYFEAGIATYKNIGADLDYAQAGSLYGDALAAHQDKLAAKTQYQLSISIYSSLGMYLLALCAFVIVSWVVKVLEATMKSVVSGDSFFNVSAM